MTQSALLSHSSSRALRVAVLEEDDELRECVLVPGLTNVGFAAAGAGTAAELYRCMLGDRFDIVVLDIGLPDEDGLSVAKHLRDLSTIGIVMLTGNRERASRIRAMNDGADAFLSKPVDMKILAATLHSLARRLGPQPPSVNPAVAASSHPVNRPWQLDSDGWCLMSPEGRTIALSAPERCVMRQLLVAGGTPVAREILIGAIARDVFDFDPHRLEMLVSRLRRKAVAQSGQTLPLMTARGSGYVFVSQASA